MDERERVAESLGQQVDALTHKWNEQQARAEQAERERDEWKKEAVAWEQNARSFVQPAIQAATRLKQAEAELEMAVVQSYDAAQTRSTVDEIRGLRAENAKLLAADLVRANDISRLTVERDAALEREVELREGLRQIANDWGHDDEGPDTTPEYVKAVCPHCKALALLSPAPATLGKYDVRVDAPGVHVTLCAASPAEQPAQAGAGLDEDDLSEHAERRRGERRTQGERRTVSTGVSYWKKVSDSVALNRRNRNILNRRQAQSDRRERGSK